MKQKIYFLLITFFMTVTAFSQQGNCLNFDGTNDQVNLGNSLSSVIDPLNTITVEAWVYPTQLTSYNGCIVGNYAYPTDNGQLQFQLRRDGTTYNFFVNDGASIKAVSAPSTVQLNTWTHIAGVWDGSEIRIYINGILQGTTSGVNGSSFVSLTNSFVIGFSLAGAPDEAFRGSIDEVRIWSSVRTQSQINTNKAVELSLPQTGLLRYYKFNNGIADANNSGVTLLQDFSTNANDGTLINLALNGTTSNWKGNSPVSTNETISGCWRSVYTGANQMYAIAANGTLWSWGLNTEFPLGLGDQGARITPTQVGTANDWKALAPGDRHVLGLKENGTLWVWGRNNQGHLGFGDTSPRSVPTQLGTATDWAKIDCGGNTSLAIKTNGTLWVWGGNNEGQLGLGDLTQRLVPTQVGTATDWVEINGAGQSTYAIKSNGTLWGTGANDSGQLGLGDNTQRTSFVQIGTDTNWSKVNVGFSAYVLAQKVDGSLWATGNNQYGQLGLNNTSSLNVFTQVGTATDWKAFTTASNNSIAIKNDNTLWTWGRNDVGQLGLGDNTNRLVPIQVGTASNWSRISGGNSFFVALKNIGEMWVTGFNWTGQLGLGDTTNRNAMTQITAANPTITPTFTQVAAICNGATLAALPTTSNNGVTGTWSPAINNTATTLYTFTPTAGLCASTTTMNIVVNPLPTAPTATAQSFCGSATVANLVPVSSTLIKWYNVATNGTALATSTALVTGTYYVSTTNGNGCESSRTAVNVTINIIPSLPTVTSPVSYVQGATASALTATIGANGTGLLWYTTATGGTGSASAFTPSTASNGLTSYWVSSTNANGCESARTQIVVQVALPASHLNFDGSNDYVSVGTSNLPVGSSPRTLETWVKIDSNAGGQSIVNYGNQTVPNSRFGLLVVNGTLLFIGEGNDYNTNVNIADNNWHHIAATYDGSLVKIYVDGILVGSDTKTLNTNNNIFNIGASCNPTPGEFFSGSIDEVRVWNVERSAAQISGSKNCELQGNEAGLVAHYKFNQGLSAVNNAAVTTLTDATANATNGILNNFALNGSTSNWLSSSPITTGVMIPTAPTSSAQTFCGSGTVANLIPATSATIKWYTSATSVTTLANATALATGTYYVAAVNSNGCESARTAVNITIEALITYYADNDGDGFGNILVSQTSCSGIPVGYVLNNTDCNDNQLLYADLDGDGFGSSVLVACGVSNNSDCNDNEVRYLDADNDGFGSISAIFVACGGSLFSTDCNDANATVYPGAVDICGDGIDNDCNGVIDNVGLPGGCIPVLSGVQGSQCGTTLATIDQYVYANAVSGGAQGYRFRVTKMIGGVPSTNPADIQSIDTYLRLFRITQLASYAFDTTYQVEVSIRRNNVWQPFYGSACTVTTPATTTSIQSSQCGGSITSMTDVIYANGVPFATGYRFRVTNLLTSQSQTIDRNIRDVRMNLLTSPVAEYNTTYSIEVAVRNTDGTYLPYGTPCNMTTPSFPTTQVQLSQCNYSPSSNSEVIYADAVSGVTQYRFRFKKGSFEYELDRYTRTFTLSLVPGLIAGETYDVQVSVLINGIWGPYAKICGITTPGGTTKQQAVVPSVSKEVVSEFKAVAYPNPFAENFKLKVTTDSQVNMQVRVYDMIGKLVEDRTVQATEMETFEVGTNYPSGVYNVIVSQGGNTQTVRVIKR